MGSQQSPNGGLRSRSFLKPRIHPCWTMNNALGYRQTQESSATFPHEQHQGRGYELLLAIQ